MLRTVVKFLKLDLFLSVLRKVGVGRMLLNFIFQRIFRNNAHVKSSVNYTSVIVGKNLHYHRDKNTLVSLASSNCLYIQSLCSVYLGENILIAPGVKIVSSNHSLQLDRQGGEFSSPIKIGDNVWLGAGAIVLPGVEIADGVVVAAGAVVTRSILEKNVVVAGCPAKIIKHIRFNNG